MEALSVQTDRSLQRRFQPTITTHVNQYKRYKSKLHACSALVGKLSSPEYIPRSLQLNVQLQSSDELNSAFPDQMKKLQSEVTLLTQTYQHTVKQHFISIKQLEIKHYTECLQNAWSQCLKDILTQLQPVFEVYEKRADTLSNAVQSHSFSTFKEQILNTWKPFTPPEPLSPTTARRFPFYGHITAAIRQYEQECHEYDLQLSIKAFDKIQLRTDQERTAATAMEIETNTTTLESVGQLVDRKLRPFQLQISKLSKRLAAPVSRKSGKKNVPISKRPTLKRPAVNRTTSKRAVTNINAKSNVKVAKQNEGTSNVSKPNAKNTVKRKNRDAKKPSPKPSPKNKPTRK